MAELFDLNPVRRFNDRAGDYVTYRPSYPTEAIDAILAGLDASHQLIAADVGAGTGISSRLLAQRGVRVLAVEPGDAMRSSAEPHPGVTWVAAVAEATGLRAESVDLVVCAQSFHWFRPQEALHEFARILRPRGRLALVWNSRSRVDPFTAGYRQAIRDVEGESIAEQDQFDPEVIVQSGVFSRAEKFSVPNFQRLDFSGLVGRSHSASYVPKTGERGRELLRRLRDLYERYADSSGHVTLVYATEVYRASRL